MAGTEDGSLFGALTNIDITVRQELPLPESDKRVPRYSRLPLVLARSQAAISPDLPQNQVDLAMSFAERFATYMAELSAGVPLTKITELTPEQKLAAEAYKKR